METPTWALSMAYWLHMLATVIWIGGLTVISLVVLPAAHKALEKQAFADLMTALQKRLDPLAWFSMVVLLASGMIQMSANPNYTGFLSIDSLWSGSILFKHLLFGLMVALSAYLTWGLLPALRRNALLRTHGKETPGFASLQRRELWLMRTNLILGLLVLLLTAVARAVS